MLIVEVVVLVGGRSPVDFTINGQRVSLDVADIQRAAKDLVPGSIRSHVVEIDGIEYPVKQVFSEATGLDLLDFTTNQARRALRSLGFEPRRVS